MGWARLLKEEKYQKQIGIYQFNNSTWYLPSKKGMMIYSNMTGNYFNAVCRFGIFAAFKFAEICPVLKYNFREIGQDSSTVPGGGSSFQVKYNAFMSPSGIDSGKRFGDVSTDPKSPYKVWNDWRNAIFDEWFENTFQEFLAYDVVNDYIGY